MRRLEIVKTIICEKENSLIVPLNCRNPFQRLKLSRIYELLVVLRILLTLNLQPGWIHQDEFTNSLEVVAGDYFNIQVFKSSEFNSTFPTRSSFFLHSTIYLPYLFTSHHLINVLHPLGKEWIPSSQLLILIPRIFYVCLSFIVDFMLLKFCKLQSKRHQANLKSFKSRKNNNTATSDQQQQQQQDEEESDDEHKVSSTTADDDDEDDELSNDHSIRLVILASSQILLIFSSRTHSSSLSLIFYSILIYLVSHSMYVMSDYLPILNKYHSIDCRGNPILKIKTGRELKGIGYSSIQHLHWITLIIVAGIFNDPDFFLSYACVPLFFYLQRGISNPHIGMTHFHGRIFTFLAYFISFSIPFILWDSFYYGRVSYDDFYNLNLSSYSFVITPVHYFASKLHYLRDFPTLFKITLNYLFTFNILGIMGLTSFSKELYDVATKDWKDKPKLDSQWIFLNCSWFISLILTIQYKSVFDLVPLIFPLVYMHGHKIPLISRFNSKLGLSWFIINLIGIVYWGYISQSGILNSFLDFTNKLTPIRYNNTHVDIILSQMIAIPPTFLLALPMKWKTFLPYDEQSGSCDNTVWSSSSPASLFSSYTEHLVELPKIILKLESSPKIRVLHTGHSPLPLYLLESELHRIINTKKLKNSDHKINLLLLPSNLRQDVQNSFKTLRMRLIKTYWSHLELDWTIFTSSTTSTNNFNYNQNDVKKIISKGGSPIHSPSTVINYQYNYPNISYGLDLYTFVSLSKENEPFSQNTHNSIINAYADDDAFVDNIFNWDNEQDLLSYFIQTVCISFAMFLFVMSYVTFML